VILHQFCQTQPQQTQCFLDISPVYAVYPSIIQANNLQNIHCGRNGAQGTASILYSMFLILFNQLAALKNKKQNIKSVTIH